MSEPGLICDQQRLPEDLRLALSELNLRKFSQPVRGEAAVLLPILWTPPEPELLLTRRTQTVGTHKGQISFPGGKKEAEDSFPVQTALRETEEELGVPPKAFEILGRFHDYLSITNYRVAPVVALSRSDLKFRPNPDEVASVLRIPLRFFLETRPRQEIRQKLGRIAPVYFYDYQEHVVWGLTAAIIRDFCQLLGELISD